MLRIAAICLLVHVDLSSGQYESPYPLPVPDPYPRTQDGLPFNHGQYAWWSAPNGKLAHSMRTFGNITFDWSSRKHDGKGDLAIPECHEQRLRMTFFEVFQSSLMLTTKALESLNTFTSGHYVYPLVLAVQNGTSPKQVYYAAAVHRGSTFMEISSWIDRKPTMDERPDFVQIVIIDVKTWSTIWSRWSKALAEGKDICNDTSYFDSLLPLININGKTTPQYADLVGTYSDITSDTCGATGCGTPTDQQETITVAYPTAEGAHQLLITPRVNGYISSIQSCRDTADAMMVHLLRDYYYRTKPKALGTWISPEDRSSNVPVYNPNMPYPAFGNILMEESFSEKDLRRIQCVFYAPFC